MINRLIESEMKHRCLFIFVFALFLSAGNIRQGFGQADPSELFNGEKEVYFRFEISDPALLPEIGRSISIDRPGEEGYVHAYANRKGFETFLSFGLKYEILPHPGDFDGYIKMLDEVNIRQVEEWDFYPTYEAYIEMMYQFESDYPALCNVFSIGNTVEGRELLVARISDNVNLNENEPRFLYTSSIHGDETTGYVLMLRLIDYLLSNYGSNDKVTGLVNGIEIWINPLANPDGTYFGGNNTVNGARRFNYNGIDLNRNYPDPAAGPHPDGHAWQVETIAFMDMAEDHHFVSGANIHGGAEVCNYPWDTWQHLTADDDWWVHVCREYADTVHEYSPSFYMTFQENGITNGFAWYTITGGRQDYMNYFQQCREFTLEISNTKLLPPSQLPAHWEYNYRSMLNYMEHSTFGLRGTVRDSITNMPVTAQVYIMGHEEDSSWVYSSLPSGNYHRLLYEGTYSAVYSCPGYNTRIISNIQVFNHEATVINVKLLDTLAGIDENPVSRAISIFPNPVQRSLVRVESPYWIKRYEIFDQNGKVEGVYNCYEKKISIPLSHLSPGIYFIKFSTEKGSGVKKLILTN